MISEYTERLNVKPKEYSILGLFKWKTKVVDYASDRHVRINVPDKDIVDNKIETTRYNYITFFPKNLFEQF